MSHTSRSCLMLLAIVPITACGAADDDGLGAPASSGGAGTQITPGPTPTTNPTAPPNGTTSPTTLPTTNPTTTPTTAPTVSPTVTPPGSGPFPAVTDFAAPGPFQTTTGPASGADCTLFHPTTLGENGLLHPIIIWGNGTTATPPMYAAALTHWASHGFVVAAANTSNAGTGREMLACLDWLTTQAGAGGSPFQGRLDLAHVGASGHSQGGGGTLMAGVDARVTVTAPLQPYTQQGFGGYDRASIGQQKGAMFLMSGSGDFIAAPGANQQIVYDTTNVPVFWGTLQGADHLGSATGNISGYRGPSTAWFRLHLMGDESARPLFYGPSCGLCGSGEWQVQRRGIE